MGTWGLFLIGLLITKCRSVPTMDHSITVASAQSHFADDIETSQWSSLSTTSHHAKGSPNSNQSPVDNTLMMSSVETNHTHDCIENEKIAHYMNEIYEYLVPKLWQWILIVCNGLVFIVGLVGNALVCVAVARNCSMHTVTNYFIANLAVADFLVILLCLPPSVLWDITSTWFFGRYMCKTFLYIQTVSVTVSVLTLTVISIDRWYAICYPLRFKSTTRRAQTAMVVIWTMSLLLDIPELIVYDTVPYPHEYQVQSVYFTQCVPTWNNDIEQKWIIVRILVLYILPVMLMTVFYVQIVRALWQSQTVLHGGICEMRPFHFSIVANASAKGQLQTRKKCARMLVSVVGIFAICYFPVHFLSLIRLVKRLSNSDCNKALAMISHWLCYANSAVNPIIYNFMSGKFRKEFRRAMKCHRRPQTVRVEFKLVQKSSGLRTTSGTSLLRSDANRDKR